MLSEDGKKMIIILCVLTPITTLFCILRWIPRRRNKAISYDDYLLAFALFMLHVQDAGAFTLAVKGGMGYPMATLNPDQIRWLLLMFYWPALGYTILISTIKFSVLISYKRIFSSIRWFQHTVHILMALTGAWFIAIFFTVMFQCSPVNKVWNPMKPGQCIDFVPFLWGNSISNNILDYCILLLPVIPVWQLQLSGVQKVLLLGSFALGSVACVAGTLRAVSTRLYDPMDASKSVFHAAVWIYVEPSMGIMGACLPFLAQTFRQRLLRIFNTISSMGSKAKMLVPGSSRKTTTTGETSVRSSNGSDKGQYGEYEVSNDEGRSLAVSKKTNITVKSESVRESV